MVVSAAGRAGAAGRAAGGMLRAGRGVGAAWCGRGARAVVALGSNLGDRAAHLRRALRALAQTPGLRVLRVSRIYETAPIGAGGGPPQGDYLNAVVELQSALPPRLLLARLQQIERTAGRRRTWRNAPRTLDLDLLFHGAAPRGDPDLVLPHPRLHLRGFVLAPLAEIKPALRHPCGVRIADLAARLRQTAKPASGAGAAEPAGATRATGDARAGGVRLWRGGVLSTRRAHAPPRGA
ncbi:MAG: 2-amino-4-hydroxy-6-hydroxymethyldihydropteridine diphosphokinase [Deltaproteobacteria bacterium]|nr:2-amino-4-hydroxy-6-hydroxymethyldihydropteridine diphosphokinase [Deltaproteobacteria bacterium]